MRRCALIILGLCLLASIASAATPLTLTKFSALEVALTGARCLDGSPAGYYFRPATNSTDSAKWIIYLEGGGLCYTPSDCADRVKSDLGSSTKWKESRREGNLLSDDAVENPDFYQWNHVFVPYCSGDLHSGQRRVVAFPPFQDFYFAGHLTVAATIKHLRDYGLNGAKELILSGSSAGGIGTFINAEFVAQQFPQARFTIVPMAGFFLDITPFNPMAASIGVWLSAAAALYDAYLPLSCVEQNANFTGRCYCANWLYPSYINVPTFVAENQYDTNQLYDQDNCPQGNSDASRKYVQFFGEQMRASLQHVIDNPRDGLFAPSCLLHGVDWNDVVVDGQSWRTSLGNWYFRRSGPTKVLDTCGVLPCTPNCKHL